MTPQIHIFNINLWQSMAPWFPHWWHSAAQKWYLVPHFNQGRLITCRATSGVVTGGRPFESL